MDERACDEGAEWASWTGWPSWAGWPSWTGWPSWIGGEPDESRWRSAWIALGANLGDPRRALRRARGWLDALPGAHISAASRVHRTAPVGPPQPDYLNAVVRVATRLPPRALLGALQEMEAAAGRIRGERWGARTLDLDLLLYGDRVVADATLTVPHPRLHERSFVLAPLCDIDPDLVHPLLDRTMADLLNECVDGDPHRQGATARAARSAQL